MMEKINQYKPLIIKAVEYHYAKFIFLALGQQGETDQIQTLIWRSI
jgi:hypothetical protein